MGGSTIFLGQNGNGKLDGGKPTASTAGSAGSPVNDSCICTQWEPDSATDAAGNAVVAWRCDLQDGDFCVVPTWRGLAIQDHFVLLG